MLAEFILTDGRVRIDMLSANKYGYGIGIESYTPGRPQPKDGGVWRDSPLSVGRRRMMAIRGNVNDTLVIKIAAKRQAELIATCEALDILLEKAASYGEQLYQDEPIWIQAVARGETERRYALVVGYSWSEYPDPYHEPFVGGGPPVMDGIVLGLERQTWTATPPGVATGVEIGAFSRAGPFTPPPPYFWPEPSSGPSTIANFRSGDVDEDYPRYGPAYYGYNTTRLDNQPLTFPFDLFETGAQFDQYWTSLAARPKAIAIAFNISTPVNASVFTVGWYVSNSGTTVGDDNSWTDITSLVNDGTEGFTKAGLRVVSFTPPAAWTLATLTGFGQGYWIRFRIESVSGLVTIPQVDEYLPHEISRPAVTVASGQINGSIDALSRIRLMYHATEDLSAYELQFVILALRSLSRGSNFEAFIHAYQLNPSSNPNGVTVTTNSNTVSAGVAQNDNTSPTGFRLSFDPLDGPTLTTWYTAFTIHFDSTVAREYYGRFRMFVRMDSGRGVNANLALDMQARYRLKFATSTNSIVGETKPAFPAGATIFAPADLGYIEIPPSGQARISDLADQIDLSVEIRSDTGLDWNVNFFDVILMPADEWMTQVTGDTPNITETFVIDVDSITNPRERIRALLRLASNDAIVDTFQVQATGEAILRTNSEQRIWVLMHSTPEVTSLAATIQVFKQQRHHYLRSE